MQVVVTPAEAGAPRFAAPPPLALYLHFPWCLRKCPYCDFNSHEARGAIPEDDYVAALMADLESALPLVWGRRVHAVFIGGGTPSLMSAAALERILSGVRARLALEPGAEITLEANPGTAEAGKFAAFRAAGVNRLSLGVQSFDSGLLAAIGRVHDGPQARRAVELALRHFDNLNLDLMYGLPGQTPEQAERDAAEALAYGPQHLSAYHLTLEPNTAFARQPPALPGDEQAAEMQAAVEGRMAAAGFEHYETSAFARPGRRCRHNLNYWTFGDYLGIGPGAHGKLSFPGRVLRQARHRHPREYLAQAASGNAVAQEHEVPVRELPFEFMMNALRLNDGFAAALFEERTGLPLLAAAPALAAAERRGLLARDAVTIAPTALGRRFLNDLLQLFLDD